MLYTVSGERKLQLTVHSADTAAMAQRQDASKVMHLSCSHQYPHHHCLNSPDHCHCHRLLRSCLWLCCQLAQFSDLHSGLSSAMHSGTENGCAHMANSRTGHASTFLVGLSSSLDFGSSWPSTRAYSSKIEADRRPVAVASCASPFLDYLSGNATYQRQ